MDQDTPIPSIETDDLPPTSNAGQVTNARHNHRRASTRMSLDSAAATPLPPSSPLKSPHKTPKPQRYAASPKPEHVRASPHSSTGSPTNHDRQATPPILQSKRSIPNLNGVRSMTPSKQPYLRRTSSNLNPTSPSASMKQLPVQPAEKPPLTPASVAQDYFRKELEIHSQSTPDTETIVFVHDSCYGHRFARPRTSKAALSTIVERPERIHATILGACTAYIRLGDRHSQGKYGPHPRLDPKETTPPFKIRKTSRSINLNHASVTHVHGSKWMEELQIMCDSAEGKLALNGKELARPIGYGKDENGLSLPKLHEGDLYLCSESLDALQGCLGGVCDAADSVFSSGPTKRAFVCIRPPGHHCSSNYPSGFCWLNNVHVGIAYAAMTHGLTHAAIIDFDLHHGDGSQSIAWQHNRRAQTLQKNAAAFKKTPVGYFSLHDINSYPCEMGDEEKVKNASLCIENAHGQSIWNVHLEPWKDHDDFWRLYKTRYSVLLEKTRIFLRHHTSRINGTGNAVKAKAAIFISAGFDASEWEGEGMQRHKVNVPTDFYAKFTADVVRLAEEEGLGVDGRVVSVLEGGYSDRALTSGVLSHVCGLTTQNNAMDSNTKLDRHSYGMDVDHPSTTLSYNSGWWARNSLEMLEAQVNPRDTSVTKKLIDKTPGNYTSPTQASTAKMTDQARERRSLSAQFDSRLTLEPQPEKPPPEVDWATAAFELSRLIIPNDRQTLSCRHDELNADANRARRERQSTVGLPSVADERMQLRDRKSKPLPFEAAPVRPPSRGERRRTTIAAVADLPDPGFSSGSGGEMANGRPRRRSSAGSSIISGFQEMKINEPDRMRTDESRSGTESRASSVLPQKAPKAPAPKKVRAAPATKPAVKARSSPKKATGPAPPVPRLPSAYMARSRSRGSSAEEIVTDQLSSSQARSGSAASVVRADDVDGLSSGMKKMSIKLNVRSQDEVASEEPGALQEKPKKPRAPRKPAVPKASKITKTAPNKPSSVAGPASSIVKTTSSDAINELDHPQQNPAPAQPTVSDPALPNIPSEGASPLTTLLMGSGVSSVPLQMPTPTEQASVSESMQAVDPVTIPSQVIDPAAAISNTNISNAQPATFDASPPEVLETPPKPAAPIEVEEKPSIDALPSTVRKTKADLPTFTSSSPIPFAKPLLPNATLGMINFLDSAKANVKETVDSDPSAGSGALKGNSATPSAEIKPIVTPKLEEPSIWDIPETPQK